jgi:hypothetical protein
MTAKIMTARTKKGLHTVKTPSTKKGVRTPDSLAVEKGLSGIPCVGPGSLIRPELW